MAAQPASKKRKTGTASDTISSVRQNTFEAPSYGNEIINVNVSTGDSRQTFAVHKDLLVKHSEILKLPLSDRCSMESVTGSFLLPGYKPEHFEVFARFLYTGQISSAKDGDFKNKSNGEHEDKEWDRLLRLYTLGARLLSSSFKDALIDVIIVKLVSTNYYPTGAVRHAYSWLGYTSGLRRLVVDIAIFWRSEQDIAEVTPSERNFSFLLDMAIAFKRLHDSNSKSTAPFEGDHHCHYHDTTRAASPATRLCFVSFERRLRESIDGRDRHKHSPVD